jgi:hypothetical protein
MKAARLHRYDESVPPDSLEVEEIGEPKIEAPLDVIVRVGATGLCAPTSTSSRDNGNTSKILTVRCCSTHWVTRTRAG